MNQNVFAIERCSIHDGPGVRTTVFLKGCPLKCLWCHNPESQSVSPELYFLHEKCTHCGACVEACPHQCHVVAVDRHEIDRSFCETCGRCVAACPSSALEIKGRKMEPLDILKEIEKDSEYYEASGGGMTLSGGEPMIQFEFSRKIASLAKQRGIHVCLETSGYAPTARFTSIQEQIDLFLFDYKESDPVKHQQWTGVKNDIILENLFTLDKQGAQIILRCPLIPGLNDREDHLRGIAQLANRLKNLIEVNVMPYHPMGMSKSVRIGKRYPLPDIDFVDEAKANEWIGFIQSQTKVPVQKG